MLVEMAKPYNENIRLLVRAKHERGYFSILAKIAFYGCRIDRKKEIIKLCQNHLRKELFFLLGMPIPFNRRLLILMFAFNFKFTAISIQIAKKIIRGNT